MDEWATMRNALATFLGTERYREFVRQLNGFGRHAGRLRFWQDEAWDEFTRLHPEFALPFDQIFEGLRVCWVHGCRLELTTRRVVAPENQISYDRDYEQVWRTQFPYSPQGSIWPLPTALAEVECCPSCEQARNTWEQEHA